MSLSESAPIPHLHAGARPRAIAGQRLAAVAAIEPTETTDAIAAERAELRRRLRDCRRAVRGVERANAEAQIAALIGAHPWFTRANRILAYRSFDGEVGLDAVLRHAIAAGKQVAYAHAQRRGPMRFVSAWWWRFSPSGCPIPEGPTIDFATDDLMLVPGVGFTRDGHRLGLGRGHYDRTLASRQVRTLGVAFACQLVHQLPLRPWDRRVEAVITDAGRCPSLDLRSA